MGTGKSVERVENVARPPNVDAAFLDYSGGQSEWSMLAFSIFTLYCSSKKRDGIDCSRQISIRIER